MQQQVNELPTHVAFAGQIAEIAEKELHDFSTIFNGLTISTAAFMLDYVTDMNGDIDDAELLEVKAQFNAGLDKALEFARGQVIAVRKAAQTQS